MAAEQPADNPLVYIERITRTFGTATTAAENDTFKDLMKRHPEAGLDPAEVVFYSHEISQRLPNNTTHGIALNCSTAFAREVISQYGGDHMQTEGGLSSLIVTDRGFISGENATPSQYALLDLGLLANEDIVVPSFRATPCDDAMQHDIKSVWGRWGVLTEFNAAKEFL